MDMTAVLKSFFGMLSTPTILFMCVVAPLWIIMHYKAQRRDAGRLDTEEQATVEDLTRIAERMESRIGTLEKILDAEMPQWRQRWKDHGR